MRTWWLWVLVLAAGPARAAPSRLVADPAVALTVSGVAVAATIVAGLVLAVDDEAFDEDGPGELLGFDQAMRGRWQLGAHGLSNATLLASLSLPLVAHGALRGPGQQDAFWVYAETMTTTLLANTVTKRLVRRRRPYSYGDGGADRARAEGTDARLSFYSGHAASSFAAAITGALSMSLRSADQEARALTWSLGLAAAAATSVFRVRAGRHFPSDVAVGALAGTAMGILFPLLHAEGELSISGSDLGAAACGLVGGVVLALVWPLDLPELPPVAVGPADAEGGVVASLSWAL